MQHPPRVYLSGPITLGDKAHNLKQATDAAKALILAGFSPLCPHLSMLYEWEAEVPHATWIDIDLPWVLVSDAVLRLPGQSKGADAECEFAFECDIPVFHDMAGLQRHFAGWLPVQRAAG